jgi:hypothetical protein
MESWKENTPNLAALNLYVIWMEGKFREEWEIVVLLFMKANICAQINY